MVQVDAKTVYLLGGVQFGEISNKTWIIFDSMNNFIIKKGQPMKQNLLEPSCATMNLNGKIFIIVLGRRLDEESDVQILDTSSESNGWTFGMYLY